MFNWLVVGSLFYSKRREVIEDVFDLYDSMEGKVITIYLCLGL